MIYLTRKKGESLRIGEAEIRVSHLSGARVCLEITSPDLPVLRGEFGGQWVPCPPARNVIEATRQCSRSGGGSDPAFSDSDCSEPDPTRARPGTRGKVEELARRIEAGQQLFHGEDSHSRITNVDEMARWVAKDRPTPFASPREISELPSGISVTVFGVLTEVSHAGICRGTVVVRDSISGEWYDVIHDVEEGIDSQIVQRVLKLVLGEMTCAEEWEVWRGRLERLDCDGFKEAT